jgi:hypothetical protein
MMIMIAIIIIIIIIVIIITIIIIIIVHLIFISTESLSDAKIASLKRNGLTLSECIVSHSLSSYTCLCLTLDAYCYERNR